MQQTTLISGASGAIGGACALAMAQRGDRIAVHFHQHQPEAEGLMAEILDMGGIAKLFRADLTRREEVQRLCADIAGAFGAIDVLVNMPGRLSSRSFRISKKATGTASWMQISKAPTC